MTTWHWVDWTTVEVTTDKKETIRFTAEVKESEFNEFYNRMADEGETYTILKRAKASFVAGTAYYQDAHQNVKALVQELNSAARMVSEISRDIEVFFQPLGLTSKFEGDREGLMKFAMDATARWYTKAVSAKQGSNG